VPEKSGATGTAAQPGYQPTRIGPFKILRPLGKGGMGTVYLAEQTEPVQRQVAIKVINPGLDSKEVIARFEAERQALALMKHPNIAWVLEANATDDGRPYFVMELVDGTPITRFCEDKNLTHRQRVELFLPVCQAIQHAHYKAIIHRDIKPSNVLVCVQDGKPVPKVIDFGVAKALETKLTEQTLVTQVNALVGTVPYMSPEQAELNQPEVDTRSDVYALGVLLYQLLTGKLPYPLEKLSMPAMLRTIIEKPPTPASRFNKALRGDLEAILTLALEKEKGRRYQSANELSEDLERYLKSQPVRARARRLLYRSVKFARRHWVGVTSTAAVLLAMVLGTAFSSWYAFVAKYAKLEVLAAEADSYQQAVAFAVQRGAWREVVANEDKALATDRFRSSVPLQLQRLRALDALHEEGQCLPALQHLAGRSDLGDNEAAIRIFLGEILLGQNDSQAEQLIRQAQDRGLSPADESYAQALLAETTPEAVASLYRCLQLDSYRDRPHVRTSLALLLILLARFAEARNVLAAQEALFPDDLLAKTLRVSTLALEGDGKSAEAALAAMRDQLTPSDFEVLQTLNKFFAQIRNPANVPDPFLGTPNLITHAMAAAPAIAHVFRTPVQPDLKGVLGTFAGSFKKLPIPLVRRMHDAAVRLLPPSGVSQLIDRVLGRDDRKQVELLTWAVRAHPEGTILYWRALTLFGERRWEEARKAALEAADTPAFFLIRRPALLIAANSTVPSFPPDRFASLTA
jgi:tetratricopeptide (TPR) repeat protein/tRNA A-37 threonylcarbamoyl transferase component Bud32